MREGRMRGGRRAGRQAEKQGRILLNARNVLHVSA